jgi:hypothetical protein
MSLSVFTVLATSKFAAGALAAGVLTVGGTGVAAYAGALPAEVQLTAHELIGAPAPTAALVVPVIAPEPSPTATPTPAPTSPSTPSPTDIPSAPVVAAPAPVVPVLAETEKDYVGEAIQQSTEGQKGEVEQSGWHEDAEAPKTAVQSPSMKTPAAPAVSVAPNTPAGEDAKRSSQRGSNGNGFGGHND